MRLAFEQKALRCYEEVCVNKGLVRQASIGSHSLPTYVSEWIVSRHLSDGQIDDVARRRMRQFMNKHLPSKDQKELLKARLKNGETLLILDNYAVEVDLRSDEYMLKIPCLDEHRATIQGYIVEKYPLLLGGGVWGVGRLEYQPLIGTDDIRDRNAITRLAAGYLKLLFPDLQPSPAELLEYCLRPAAALRQTVRDQLAMMDPEYKRLTIDVALPTD